MEGNLAPTKAQLVNLFWRSTWTAIQSFGAALTSNPIASLFGRDIDISAIDAATIAAGAAVFSVISVFARDKLGTGTAAEPQRKGAENAAGNPMGDSV